MSGSIPCLGYPSRTAAVLALRIKGLSTRMIADKIGIEPTTVTALEASARRKPGFSTAKQHTVAIDNDVLAKLLPHAERRGTSVNVLVRQLLAILADDDLVDALLDDDAQVAA